MIITKKEHNKHLLYDSKVNIVRIEVKLINKETFNALTEKFEYGYVSVITEIQFGTSDKFFGEKWQNHKN